MNILVSILALVTPHANYIFFASYYIVVCGMSSSTIFFTLTHKRDNFRKNLLKINMCFDFIYKLV